VESHPLRRAVRHGEVLDCDPVTQTDRKSLTKPPGVVRVRLERNHAASFADEVSEQAREHPTVRADVGTRPTGLDESADGRL
jgi:hypothetical protein